LITACLPIDLLARLREAIGDGYEVRIAGSWGALQSTAATGVGSRLLVLDPQLAPEDVLRLEWACAIRRAMAASAAVRTQAIALALRGHDDSPTHLRYLVDRLAAHAVGERAARLLEPRLVDAPYPVRVALHSALATPTRFRTVDALAETVGIPAPTLRRWTRRVHVAGPKLILTVGRVVWAHHYIRTRRVPLHVLAQRLSYESPRDLARHVRRLLGVTPLKLRDMDEGDLLEQLEPRLLSGEEDALSDAPTPRLTASPPHLDSPFPI
jgi:methylphosphotriester-DNA--protein-cysteine methyltransferase